MFLIVDKLDKAVQDKLLDYIDYGKSFHINGEIAPGFVIKDKERNVYIFVKCITNEDYNER